MENVYTIKSISELHNLLGIAPPKHPAISFIKFSDMKISETSQSMAASTEFYIISLKGAKGSLKYGRNYYDFEEGTMLFTGPNQIVYPSHLTPEIQGDEGWSLFFHPDLLYSTNLGEKMNEYTYFSYELNEALHLSEVEKTKIADSIENIIEEYSQNIDQHSQELIVSNLELVLNYCKRFYGRQFLTRKKQTSDVVISIEKLLLEYFDSDKPLEIGLPSVKYCAEELNLSPNYLSDLLKKETGKNTKEHIDYYLLEKAKRKLLNSNLNINQIAYDLGFEDPKSFSKLFKKKLGVSPVEYRKAS